MNIQLAKFKKWYEYRSTRERLFVLGLSFALIYTIFYFILFRPAEHQKLAITEQILVTQKKIDMWNLQIANIRKIADSPMYKQWLKQKQTSSNISGKYQNLLQTFSLTQWQDIIKTIIQPHANVRIEQIKNLPEKAVPTSIGTDNNKKIYQRNLALTIYSDFFNTIDYMDGLEKSFPNIQWESLDYQVVHYPAAKIEMELSVYYEKQ